MRIVIAEKDQIGRRLLAQLLRMEGHEVILVEEGADTKLLMKQHRPDVVLMDMFTLHRGAGCATGEPVGQGAECLSPVVMMTSMGACERLSSFMGMGGSVEADGFDRLPSNAKIGAMDHVQRICEVLARGMRSPVRNAGRSVRGSEQGVLDFFV